jgi:hypothetical protein
MIVTWKRYGMKQFLSIGGTISELTSEHINKKSKLNTFYRELSKCIFNEGKTYLYETQKHTYASHKHCCNPSHPARVTYLDCSQYFWPVTMSVLYISMINNPTFYLN